MWVWVQSNVVCLGACSLTNPACNAPSCCQLRPLWLHHILPYYLTNGMIFGKKKSLYIKCVFWFSLQLLFETLLILRRIQRDIVIHVKSLHVKYSLLLSDFNESWIFATEFRKELKCQVSSKSVQWEPSCSTRGDITKLIAALAILRTRLKTETNWAILPSFLSRNVLHVSSLTSRTVA